MARDFKCTRSPNVKGMADQLPDQGGSESRVSWSEVVCPCGVRVSFGSTLPRRVRVTSAVEKAVDGVTEGEVHTETGVKELFQQHDDGFASVESSRTRYGDFSGSREPSRDRILGQTAPKWQDRDIIPV